MKKIILFILAAALVAISITACSPKNTDSKVLKIGASVTPHSEILEEAKTILAKDGIILEITKFDDYILPNTAVEDGTLDANYFQHEAYLKDFNPKNDTHLVSVGAIHYEPFGVYPGKTKSIADIKDGATIGIPNDGSNEARALFLLEAQGLITLKEGTDFTATILDIATNPKKLDIKELDAAQIPRSLQDMDLGVINGNYAIQAGLNVAKDAVATEDKDSDAGVTYQNVLVVKEGKEKDENVQALLKVLKSDEIKKFIDKKYEGAVIAK